MIDPLGELKETPVYNDFGLVRIRKTGKEGMIDKSGKIIIEPICDELYGFDKDGTTHYSIAGKFGIINKDGKTMVKPEYEEIHYHLPDHDRVVAEKDGVTVILDASEKEIRRFDKKIEKLYRLDYNDDYPLCFKFGETYSELGIMDKDGNVLLEDKYLISEIGNQRGLFEITQYDENHKRKSGLFSVKLWKLVLPVEFDSIALYDDNRVIVSKGSQFGITDIHQIAYPPSTGDKLSKWATAEYGKAKKEGLIPSSLEGKYTGQITRREFCELIVKVVEKITGEQAVLLAIRLLELK